MYESLKEWMDVPVSIRPFEKRSGTGDKTFKEPITIDSYPVFEAKYVRNSLGADVLTNHHFYIDGNKQISILDEVQVDSEWLPIQAIDTFFRRGKPDIKVVHV